MQDVLLRIDAGEQYVPNKRIQDHIVLSSIVPSVTISKVGGLSSSNEINYKSYRRQGSDSPAIFFTLPFSFTLDFVFTLTLA